jgi:hypothetical protein
MPQPDFNVNARTYTLQDFQNLAEQSAESQELRIRKSNQDLTNSSLGLFSKLFHHSRSNTTVNQAFKQAILTDPKYQAVSEQISSVLSTTMPDNKELTPGKIRTAIQAADTILSAHTTAANLADMAEECGMVAHEFKQQFKNFVQQHLIEHPEVKLDLRDCGQIDQLTADQRNLPPEQQKQLLKEYDFKRLTQASALLQAFYTQAGPSAFVAAGFGVRPEDMGGNAQNAQKLSDLIIRCFDFRSLVNDFAMTSSNTMPEQGSLFSSIQNGVKKLFAGRAAMFGGCGGIVHLTGNHIQRLTDALGTVSDQSSFLNAFFSAINQFHAQNPQLASDPEKMGSAISKLVDKLFAQMTDNPRNLNASFKDIALGMQIEEHLSLESLRENDEFRTLAEGIESEVLKSALNQPERLASIKAEIKTLGAAITNEQIGQIVHKQAQELVRTGADALRQASLIAQGDPEQLRLAGRIAKPLATVLDTLRNGTIGSELQSLTLLRTLYEKLATGSDDAGRGAVLHSLLDQMTKDMSKDEITELCRNSKPILDSLVGQLRVLSGQPNLAAPARAACLNVAELAMGLYGILLGKAGSENYDALALAPVSNLQPAPQIAEGLPQAKGVRRNATNTQIFAATKALEQDETIKGERKPAVQKAMQALRCDDYKLLAKMISFGGEGPEKDLTRLLGNGRTSLNETFRELKAIGEALNDILKRSPEYNPAEVLELFCDLTLTRLPQQGLGNLLDKLQSENIKDFLGVLNHLAIENDKAPAELRNPDSLRSDKSENLNLRPLDLWTTRGCQG